MKNLLIVLATIAYLNTSIAQTGAVDYARKAHQTYLADDGKAMVENIYQALLSSENDPVIVKNLTDLFDKYVVEHKAYPEPSFKLNENINFLFVTSHLVKRFDDQKVRFYFSVGMNLKSSGLIKSIKLIRYPDDVVIDTQNKIGEYDGFDGTDPYVWSDQQNTSPQLGLYNIIIDLKDQMPVNAWVILTNRSQSNDTPQIDVPALKQSYIESTPTFKWKKFKSQNNLVTDKKILKFVVKSVQQVGLKSTETDVLKVAMKADAETFKVGDKTGTIEYEGADRLSRGQYAFRLDARERNKFGPVHLIRSSISKIKFEVK